ncbi:MAG: hypothetical protein C4523_20330 [Myxococcales bacterium]|nr:MAG: hypothetical protein C4523_20330 [Myxococcales bacterium]
MGKKYQLEFLYRPGLRLSDEALADLVADVRAVAATCFKEIPDYQVMRGTRKELSDKVLSLARRENGQLAGFCSAVLLPVENVGDVLHLGLTCVRPEDRGAKLTHLLTSKVVLNYLLRRKPVGRTWISNCACVLSSLGNVAVHFDGVYPSPLRNQPPTETHRQIARTIDREHRDKMYVMPEAVLDEEAFVFRGSVNRTVFQKEKSDRRYHHRVADLNAYYQGLLDFENGDEALQIGHVSLLTSFRYFMKKRRLRVALQSQVPQPEYP